MNYASTILKTLSYKIVSAACTFMLIYIFTGRIIIAVSVEILDQLFSAIWYYGHEMLWKKWERRQVSKQVNKSWERWIKGKYKTKKYADHPEDDKPNDEVDIGWPPENI